MRSKHKAIEAGTKHGASNDGCADGQRLSRRLIEVQELERRRIALELHDEIGQSLTVLKMNLCAVSATLQRCGSAESVKDSLALIDETLQRLRNICLDLRPSLLDDFGLEEAVRWLVQRHEGRAEMTVHVCSDGFQDRLPAECETACFRIIQEALTNILRHARAQRVWITLRKNTREILVEVRDDGVGFEVGSCLSQVRRGRSLGLFGMQERAKLLGGRLHIQSDASQGTVITAVVPVPSSAEPVDAVRGIS